VIRRARGSLHEEHPVGGAARTRRDLSLFREEARRNPKESVLFDADDAVVIKRDEPPPFARVCFVELACGNANNREYCTDVRGWGDYPRVWRWTDEQCMEVVAMARSIRAAP
jgi:hypothetical protein